MGTAVGIVLNPFYGSGYTILVTFEIDNPVVPLVTATAVTNGNTSGIITAADRSLRLKQRCIGLALVQSRRNDLDLAALARSSRFLFN